MQKRPAGLGAWEIAMQVGSDLLDGLDAGDEVAQEILDAGLERGGR